MLTLGVTQVNQWNVLAEAACRTPDWESCHSAHASFHPFKGLDAYRQCQAEAEAKGSWNGDQIQVISVDASTAASEEAKAQHDTQAQANAVNM